MCVVAIRLTYIYNGNNLIFIPTYDGGINLSEHHCPTWLQAASHTRRTYKHEKMDDLYFTYRTGFQPHGLRRR